MSASAPASPPASWGEREIAEHNWRNRAVDREQRKLNVKNSKLHEAHVAHEESERQRAAARKAREAKLRQSR